MKQTIRPDQSLKDIESVIPGEIPGCEFWGDLSLTKEDFRSLGACFRERISHSSVNVEYICSNYPYCITTYMVFFAIYKFDANFWGALSLDLKIPISQPQQDLLGQCARQLFIRHGMDYSEVKNETRVNIEPILYETGIVPDSNLDDLFYVVSYDSYSSFDPQLIIDDLIDMRSYAIRKPLLRFLNRFKNDRAIDFLLEVHDAIIADEQNNSLHSRFTDSYRKWKNNEKKLSAVKRRKDKQNQSIPFLFFDEGRNGLSIMLPRIVVDSEWIDTASWVVTTKNGFKRSIDCRIFGDEGRRYTGKLSIPVEPDEEYTVRLYDNEVLEDNAMKQWVIAGIPSNKPVWFNSNGRLVNTTYIIRPYGIVVMHSCIEMVDNAEIGIDEQYYPNMVDSYRIVSVTPLGSNARLSFSSGLELVSRPQIEMNLSGKTLFNMPLSNLFVEIPKLIVEREGALENDGFELHVGNSIIPITLSNETTVIDLSNINDAGLSGYGTHSARIYQQGRFIKQVEFYYVPEFQTNYSSHLSWPTDRKELNENISLKFTRLADWEMSFEGCSTSSDEEEYMVSVPRNKGSIAVSLRSLSVDSSFRCSFLLPINPFEYMIRNVQGEEVENSAKILRTDVGTLTEEELWFSFTAYNSFADEEYFLALNTVNGIEQREKIKLSNKGSGNINLSSFYDTIRNSPLPLEIVLIHDSDEENIPIAFVSETNSFSKKVSNISTKEHDYVCLAIQDDGKDIDVLRFGFNRQSVHLTFDNAKITRDKTKRCYMYPNKLEDGIYIVSGEQTDSIFEMDDDYISFGETNNLLCVNPSQYEKTNTSKCLMDFLVKDIINIPTAAELKTKKSYQVLMNPSILQKIDVIPMDDYDIEKLVAIAYIYNERIEKKKKEILELIMRTISVSLMKRGDRFRIIELLLELDAPQEVFDTCMMNYSLLLFYSDKSNVIEIAGKVEKYSPELSMMLMMSTDGPIRDCMRKEKYIDIIGKDAFRHLLSVPNVSDNIEIVNEQKKFLREEDGSKVVINLDSEIAGNFEAIQSMVVMNKGFPTYDFSKKSEYGIYFDGIKYVDQFINWYCNTHDSKGDMNPKIESMMLGIVNDYEEKLLGCMDDLEKYHELRHIVLQYKKIMRDRVDQIPSSSRFARFFYLQGIAAFLTRLPVKRESYDKKRIVGIKFMSVASLIAPKLSHRDILMAQVYIYLKRKEESLCQ